MFFVYFSEKGQKILRKFQVLGWQCLAALKMPTHCCVPLCTRKGYRDEETGEKVSYFKFPTKEKLKKLWIYAIRRDEGKTFQVTNNTKVCSRHFKSDDLKKSFNGVVSLKNGAVPSVFAWKRSSPRKRPPPTPRISSTAASVSHNLNENISEVVESACSSESLDTSQCSSNSHLAPEMEAQQTATNFDLQSEENLEIARLEKLLADTIEIKETLESEVLSLKANVALVEQKCEQLEKHVFSFDNVKTDDSLLTFYTGFPNVQTMMALYEYLDPGVNGINIKYWLSGQDNSQKAAAGNSVKQGRPRILTPSDEFFLVMCRLRQGFAEMHLAHLFKISQSTVSRIFISWINFMYLKLGQINIWPSRKVVDESMPEAFKEKYPSTRVIIDCTEVRCQMPSSLLLNSELFSSYKNHTTLKALVGISPKGSITFIGQLYTGSISDKEMVERSGFLKLPFEQGDSVMADKGFTIEDVLPLGVSLNIPPFLGMSDQMPAEDVIKTQEIASLRIHVERAINKIKNFLIFEGVIPISQFCVVNQMWCVCAMLCNFQDPIISA